MNDIILSSLLNLFALYDSGSSNSNSESIISGYLAHHFGIKDISSSLEFYRSMREYYDSLENLDRASLCANIFSEVKAKITVKERILMILRFMEMRAADHESELNEFITIANTLEIQESIFNDLLLFSSSTGSNENVKRINYGKGILKLLYLREMDTLIFSYSGEDNIKYNDVQLVNGSFMIWQRSGVIKRGSGIALYYHNAVSLFVGRREEKRQLKLRGNDVDFHFEKGTGGIHNFTFNLYGGELVAIMGGSGTGKTTLLSLLNGSLHPQEGKITINGHSIDESGAKSLIGFVPQDDLLIAELTVYQNLYYTAKLCFDGMSEDKLNEKVSAMLHDLGLEAAKNLKAGSPVNKFISGGQRKRLNIALELIREPDVLFLDEPTSGLSSADSRAVIDLLREQAYKGKLIITNIHQPSSDIFKMFDRLWLLDVGGYPIYDGNPIEAITYFKQAAGYADAQTSMCPVCGNIDSETILSIIDEKVIDANGQITDKRKKSPQEWHELYRANATKSKEKIEDLPVTDQKRPSAIKQMFIFLRRNLKAKLSDKQWLIITLIEAPVLALICSLLTHYAPLTGYTIMDNKNLVSYFFMAVIVATFLGMSGSAEEIIKDRALLKREKFLNLSYKSYIWSKIIFMSLVALVQTSLFIVVGNSIMGIGCLFFKWWLILFVTAMLSSLIGLLLSQKLSSVVAIYITIPILLIPQILLCGLVVKFPDLAPKSNTANVPVIGDVIPSRWAFEAIAVTTFTENDYEKNFFDADREKYESRYYESAYLKELRSQNESMLEKINKGEDYSKYLNVVRNSLPLLLDVAGMDAYNGNYSYEEIDSLLDQAKNILSKRSHKATNQNDKRINEMIEEIGKEEIVELKRKNYNLQLERQVVNSEAEEMYKIVEGHIVPQAGYIYLTPVTHNGRAPFYSCVKVLGNKEIKTIWYNLVILLLMSTICTVVLLNDFPKKK